MLSSCLVLVLRQGEFKVFWGEVGKVFGEGEGMGFTGEELLVLVLLCIMWQGGYGGGDGGEVWKG